MEAQKDFPKIVRLSVGGAHFETSIDTLKKDSTSMLAAMFSGRHLMAKLEAIRSGANRKITY